MPVQDPCFFFDFVDPASYLVAQALDDLGVAEDVEWRGFEVRPPPEPIVDPADGEWSTYQARMGDRAEVLGVPMSAPAFVPWTRKAHELAELAREKGRYHDARRAIFRAHFVDGSDIGRVDLLAGIAVAAGLDGGEALAALGVDRFAGVVAVVRAAAAERDVTRAPTLAWRGRRLEGLRSASEIAEWLDKTHATKQEQTQPTWQDTSERRPSDPVKSWSGPKRTFPSSSG